MPSPYQKIISNIKTMARSGQLFFISSTGKALINYPPFLKPLSTAPRLTNQLIFEISHFLPNNDMVNLLNCSKEAADSIRRRLELDYEFCLNLITNFLKTHAKMLANSKNHEKFASFNCFINWFRTTQHFQLLQSNPKTQREIIILASITENIETIPSGNLEVALKDETMKKTFSTELFDNLIITLAAIKYCHAKAQEKNTKKEIYLALKDEIDDNFIYILNLNSPALKDSQMVSANKFRS